MMRQGWGLMAFLGATWPLRKVTADPTSWRLSFIGLSGTSGSHTSVVDAVLSLGCWLGASCSESRDHRRMFCGLLFITFTLSLSNCSSERVLCACERDFPDDFKLLAAGEAGF